MNLILNSHIPGGNSHLTNNIKFVVKKTHPVILFGLRVW